jgi:hypothetical protein
MGRLTNSFLFKDRRALPDQMSFVLTLPWRTFVFAMRNRDCTNLDEISILALSVTTKDFPHDMLLYALSLTNNWLRAAFPALFAAAIVRNKLGDCPIGLDLPARYISHLHGFGGGALFLTTTE